jgi:hypothetical protein
MGWVDGEQTLTEGFVESERFVIPLRFPLIGFPRSIAGLHHGLPLAQLSFHFTYGHFGRYCRCIQSSGGVGGRGSIPGKSYLPPFLLDDLEDSASNLTGNVPVLDIVLARFLKSIRRYVLPSAKVFRHMI